MQMPTSNRLRDLKDWARLREFRRANSGKQEFECPVCSYRGPFRDIHPRSGRRLHAECPRCGARERHRIQCLALAKLLAGRDTSSQSMIHFAPEPFFRPFFSRSFGRYETADLDRPGVDHHVDLQNLPFGDGSYDFVFASHVLEHVPDDRRALREIRRILKPAGVAVLPVPIVAGSTVEYPAPNPFECHHVRAPGYDYFDRYRAVFSRVDLVRSESLPAIHQVFIYEDRTAFPSAESPLRPPMPGTRHGDIVPICHA
jgi:SAM-dependent methyltransferase